ncbi:DMT family transporter [Apibacter sp. B2966]|uniref:DMT family transporter n=1 Tax=Apibacter sp. B2966 TaxID=2656761 RepID=UPI001409D629|nr:DMT family transporter [Apibacter sp. B2966]QII72639.1 DMT family transporter [Apibacter sp. B2966]
MKNKNLKYHILAIITICIWGTTFISTKVLMNDGLSPVEIFLYRFLLAYICIWFFSPKVIFSKNYKDEFLFLLIGLFGGTIYFITENIALKLSLTSNVSLILSTNPIVTAFFTILINKKEKVTKNLVYGSLLALFGVFLIIFNGNFILEINFWGDLLALTAVLSWTIYTLILNKLSNTYSILFITRKLFFYGIVTIIPFILIAPFKFQKDVLLTPTVIFNLLFLGIIASMVCFFTWNLSIKKIGIIKTTNYIYFVPLIAIISASIILKESITMITFLGTVCILSGVYVSENGVTIKRK